MGILGPNKRSNHIDITRSVVYTNKNISRGMNRSASAGVLLNPLQQQQLQQKQQHKQSQKYVPQQPQEQQQVPIESHYEEKQQKPYTTSPLSPVNPPARSMSHSQSTSHIGNGRPWDGEGFAAGISSQAQREGWNRTESGVAAALEQRDPQIRSASDPRLVVPVSRDSTIQSKQHMHVMDPVASRKQILYDQRHAPIKMLPVTDIASMVTYGKPSLLLNQHRFHSDAQLMDHPMSGHGRASQIYQQQQQQQQYQHQYHHDHGHGHEQGTRQKEHGAACICGICDCGAHKCSAPNFLIPRSAHYDPAMSSTAQSSYIPYSNEAIPQRIKPVDEIIIEHHPFTGKSLSHDDYREHTGSILLPSQQNKGKVTNASILSSNIHDAMRDGSSIPVQTISKLSYPGYVTRVDHTIRTRTKQKVHGHTKLFYDDDDQQPIQSISHSDLIEHTIHPKSRYESQERRQLNAKSRIRANLVDPGYADVDEQNNVADAKFSAQTTYSDFADFSSSHAARAKRPVTPHFISSDLRSFTTEYQSNHTDHKQTKICPARQLHRHGNHQLGVGEHASYEKVDGMWKLVATQQQ